MLEYSIMLLPALDMEVFELHVVAQFQKIPSPVLSHKRRFLAGK